MADEEHLAVLRQGREAWNAWRVQNPDLQPDLCGMNIFEEIRQLQVQALARNEEPRWLGLRGADLHGTILAEANLSGWDLTRADLSRADLSRANLSNAYLYSADLRGANLSGANLSGVDLTGQDLSEANLSGANLVGAAVRAAQLSTANLTEANLNGADLARANLSEADLSGADLSATRLQHANLSGADLSGANLRAAILSGTDLSEAALAGADLIQATLVGTNFTGANLTGCRVFGTSAWNVKLDGTVQKDLIITQIGEPEITVDNLQVAQFIYLLLNNERVRHVIDTITSKVVLILGRFTEERKAVLDALREELRQRDYTPVLFDFDRPASKDLTGTVQTLANMARFVIADLTDPSSVPHELAIVVPATPVTVQPLLLEGQRE